jgi:UDP-glucuronate 4-epimerase
MKVLLTGVAGFIGLHVARRLLSRGDTLVGVDNLNSYYSVSLKKARLARLASEPGFVFYRADVSEPSTMERILADHVDIGGVVHLAAQPGVRYSLENPYAYVQSNVMGQVVVLEAARKLGRVGSIVYASSSSVYGANKAQPSRVEDRVDRPVSLYAATKGAAELIARSYAHLHGVPCTGLRFFTVYGPWGRPDMAPFIFTKAILAGDPINVFGYGDMARDFTYVDDIVTGVVTALDRPPAPDEDGVPHRVYNLGNNRSESLVHFIEIIEQLVGRQAAKILLPLQPGDVVRSYADIDSSKRDLGFDPSTGLLEGMTKFISWYKEYTEQSESL